MGFKTLNEEIAACRLCPRLVQFRETVPAKKCYADEVHWRKPIAGFGDPKAWLLILGLAPSIDGANRTGRIFTGDPSAKFLIENLYKAGFANQPTSLSADDGLELIGCYMTPVVKCVPPEHRPNPGEIRQCSGYLKREMALLKSLKCVLVLGQIAFDAYLAARGLNAKGVKFAHGARVDWEGEPTLFTSFHPSPQNTNTGKLTGESFQRLLREVREKQPPLHF